MKSHFMSNTAELLSLLFIATTICCYAQDTEDRIIFDFNKDVVGKLPKGWSEYSLGDGVANS